MDYDKIMSSKASEENKTRASEKLAQARRAEADATRGAGAAIQGYLRDMANAEAAAQRAGSLTNKLSEIGRTAGYALRGSLIAIVPVLIEDALGAVGALAGALGPLAGAATIAGIGVESLKFATQGFGQAMKDIRDTTKFNEDLRKLAPSAQAAATSLRDVLPVIDNIQRASQQALFAGLDDQIRNLSTNLGPMVQQATVGVSEAFNNMFKSAGNELMAPGTMSSIQNIINSTINTFKSLEPAIAPAVSALTNFLDVGASFGPGLADTINRLAQEFSTFIQSARDDGSLAKWMQRGLEAAETLIGAVKDISLALNSMGDDGAGAIQSIVGMVKVLSGVIRTLNGDIGGIGAAFTGSGDVISSEIQSWLGPLNAAIKGVNMFIRGMNSLTGMNKAEIPLLTNEDLSTDTVEEKLRKRRELAPRNAGGTLSRGGVPIPGPRGSGGLGDPVNAAPGHGLPLPYGSGAGTSLNAPSGGGWSDTREGFGSPFSKPPSKSGGSDHDRRDAIIAGLSPSEYQVNPYAQVPGMPAVPQTGLTGGPMSPYGGSAYGVTSADVFEKEHGVEKNASDLEEARKARIAMERDNTATAQDVEEARKKETEAAYQLWKSQQDLVDKQRGTTAQLKKGMDDLGAALDPDFGLGKGLAGLAENLVKFVGNIATAPMRAKLQETVDKDPIKGGYGLLGIRGAQNIAAGTSPLLGNPLPDGTQAQGLGGQAQSYGAVGPQAAGFGPAASAPQTAGFGPAAATTGGATAPSAYAGGTGAYGARMGLAPAGPKAAGEYGLPAGTDTGGYGTGSAKTFPPWVMAMANAFGIKPSTYAGHQESNRNEAGYAPNPNHENRAIDWSGPPEAMQKFADYLKTVPQDLEQVIWNGAGVGTGDTVEIAGGRPQPGYFAGDLAGHGNHVHTRQSVPIPLPPWAPGAAGDPAAATTGGPTAPSAYSAPFAWGTAPTLTGSSPGGWGPSGTGSPAALPGSGGLGGGQSPVWGAGPSVGTGNGVGANPFASPAPTGPGAGPTTIGGLSPGGVPGGGGPGGVGMTPGGSLDTALGVASMGLDMIAPGAGQAAQVGIKEANRAIQFAGQAGAIGVEGVMQTLLPTGGSELANNSWFSRIAGGLASATPALPNVAGGAAGKRQQDQVKDGGPPGPLTPDQVAANQGQNPNGGGVTNNVTVNNSRATEDGTGRDVTHHLGQSAAAPMGGMGTPR